MITYEKLYKKPQVAKSLIGMSLTEFTRSTMNLRVFTRSVCGLLRKPVEVRNGSVGWVQAESTSTICEIAC